MLEELLDQLKKINYQERIKLLEDKKVVDTIFLLNEQKNPRDFEKVLELYDARDLLNLLDKNLINKIKNKYPNMEFLFLEFLKDKDQVSFEESLKNNQDLKEFLLFKGANISIHLTFSYEIVLDLINYVEINNLRDAKTCLFTLIRVSLNDTSLQEKFLNSNIPDYYKIPMFHLFDKNIVTSYINSHIVNLKNKDIYNLLMYSRVELHPNIYETKDFFRECIVKKTTYETRMELERLGNMIDTAYFENLLKREELKVINAFRENKNMDSLLNDINQDMLLDIVIDYLFQDSSHNVYLNVYELVDFCLKNNELLEKDKLAFYKELLELYKNNKESILNFFYRYKDKFKSSDFYDDLYLARNKSYEMIKTNSLRINDIQELKNNELSSRYNLDIYELKGEPFKMLISCKKNIPDKYTVSSRNCYTLISDLNMKVIYNDTYIFGYLDYDIKNILHVYEDDSYSNDYESKKTTSYVNRIRTPDEIINSNYRSEIQIINDKEFDKYKSLMPSFIVCFDRVSEKDIEASRLLNIPIIIIYEEKYHVLDNYTNIPNYEEEYTLMPYMESSALEKQSRRGI